MKKYLSFFMMISFFFSLYSINVMAQNLTKPPSHLQEQNTMSVLWFQSSGEAKALYYQGYSIGKMRLNELLKKKQMKGLKPAVVLDIDETILDNSPYQAWSVVTGKDYNWDEWFPLAQTKALPGAVEFLQYAYAKGVDLYYISNRKENQKEATIKNLQLVGAPQADENHVLLRQPGEKSKEVRRQQVAKTHDILLLFGDNLSDFSGFDQLSVTDRIQAVDNHREEFGKKLIVFPNPMYGDWEGAIYNYDYNKSNEEKAKQRKENLKPYQP
ncbi:5'-nucleotidase, lipoprotein e(P4) family [Neobacillus massiliamazoniensis]|uniref:5'-nucleotidase, lipoprotein e(P4) family n=2 Tax=Neobacillus massiliamazoniensis TaxID=1499688 RepID=A0A0U1NZY2_9BACI|nr:5'-nucleotidase, lipoprotein e(P4) family [Neobacillus massiliamazoniensis]CRK83599.1 5'-nucleotidase, lipoprotein e(P4) family [Neobacillus massiliamazoniensis]